MHGIATAFESPPSHEPWRYVPLPEPGRDAAAERLARFAPGFVVEAGEAEWNRIGTPVLRRWAGIERARVDPSRPTLYAEARAEEVGGRPVHQLVYRVHFEQLAPTAAAWTSLHRNAGLLVLVTVDVQSELPLCVTSVHTCGCWLAVQPTTALSLAALPPDWPEAELAIAGERLAARLPPPAPGERYVFHLRSGSHRVHAVTLEPGTLAPGVERDGLQPLRTLPLAALAELHRLPVEGHPGETSSFFYEAGYLRGHVKGAFVPLEGWTLGLLTLDPRLGMDRDFGDPRETGARFFTALLPWKREASRLDRFGRALAELGFRVEAFGPAGDG